MKSAAIIREIIDSVKGDYAVRDIRTCCYWTAVSSRGCGLASTFIDSCPRHDRPAVSNTGTLMDKSAKSLAELSLSDHLLDATIGMASLNSLIEIDESQCTQENAYNVIAPHSGGKNVVIVGHFPFASKLADVAGGIVVLQKSKGESPILDENEKRALKEADVAVITGTSLINHSLDMLLLHVNKKAVKIMVGPTTPMSPVFFDYGFKYLCGIKVVDEAMVLKSISEGATFKEVKGIKMLTMKRDSHAKGSMLQTQGRGNYNG
ncbi:MAG: DUF364 domain-containing protein [Vulcanimicrobiota bacterium]